MMLKKKLQSNLSDAIREQNTIKKQVIRMALSAIKLAEVSAKKELDDDQVLAILQKEVKLRKESIDDAKQANRPDLIEESQREIEVLKAYLPEQLTDEELETLVKEVIQEVGAESAKETGIVMKTLMPKLQGRAAGGKASQVVRKLLSE